MSSKIFTLKILAATSVATCAFAVVIYVTEKPRELSEPYAVTLAEEATNESPVDEPTIKNDPDAATDNEDTVEQVVVSSKAMPSNEPREIASATELPKKALVIKKKTVSAPKKPAAPKVVLDVREALAEIEPPKPPFSVEEELEKSTSDEQAINTEDPSDTLYVAAFEEPSLIPMDLEIAENEENLPPVEPRLTEIVGEMKQASFPDLEKNLAYLKKESEALGVIDAPVDETKPEPELVRPKADPILVAPQAKAPTVVSEWKPGPELQVIFKKEPEAPATPERELAIIDEKTTTPELVPARVVTSLPFLPTEIPGAVDKAYCPAEPLLSAILSKSNSAPLATPVPKVTLAELAAPIQAVVSIPQPRVVTPSPTESVRAVSMRQQAGEESFEGIVTGIVELKDPNNKVWDFFDRPNKKKRGHIEVYLYPLGTSDRISSEDDGALPKFTFGHKTRKWKGPHKLVAGFFSKGNVLPELELEYLNERGEPEAITAKNFQQEFHFNLSPARVLAQWKNRRQLTETPTLTAIVYEAVPGDHRILNPIKDVTARVIGHRKLVSNVSSDDGVVRIPDLFSGTFTVKFEAPGYYPTYRVVPTFNHKLVDLRVYLVRKSFVQAATSKPFLDQVQDEQHGVIVGREFDENKQPEANVRMQIASKREDGKEDASFYEKILFFDIFPQPMLPATTKTGFFGIFNVAGSLRRILRQGGRTAMVFVRPGTATYLELGRAGSKDFTGRLVQMVDGKVVPVEGALVRLARDPKSEVVSNANGVFQIKSVDLPLGTITLETRIPGFPLTWHTHDFDPAHPQATPTFFVTPSENVPKMQAFKGAIVGGASSAFLPSGEKCYKVRLLDSAEKEVPQSIGCLNKEHWSYAVTDLEKDEYNFQILDETGTPIKNHVIYVGPNRVSINFD